MQRVQPRVRESALFSREDNVHSVFQCGMKYEWTRYTDGYIYIFMILLYFYLFNNIIVLVQFLLFNLCQNERFFCHSAQINAILYSYKETSFL